MGVTALATLLILGVTASPPAPDPRELAEALAPARLGLDQGEATIGMELRDRAGRVVSRTIHARVARSGAHRKMRLTFTEPADQRGVELLVLSASDQEPVQYLWLPRSAELRRIVARERGGRFQGSDFRFTDFEDRDLAAAKVVLSGEEVIGGLRCHRIELSPGDEADASADRGYSRVTAWIARDSGVALRVQFFDGETLTRQLDVKRLQPAAERLVPTKLVMRDITRGTRTTLDITGLDQKARFPDAIFRPEALGR